jgi:hypothetical protein
MTKRTMLPQGLRFAEFRRDNFTCRYCGRSSPAVVLHVEHVKPVAAGGKDEIGNLVTSCADCNAGKGVLPDVTPPAAERAESAPLGIGLAGLYAHKLDDEGYADCQLRIVRQVGAGRWAVEFYSWWDGEPGALEIVDEAELTGPRFVLYANAEAMIHAYETKLRHPEWKALMA